MTPEIEKLLETGTSYFVCPVTGERFFCHDNDREEKRLAQIECTRKAVYNAITFIHKVAIHSLATPAVDGQKEEQQ